MQAWLLKPWAKPLVFTLCLLPFAWLFYAAFTDGLGANPAEALLRQTGNAEQLQACINSGALNVDFAYRRVTLEDS